MINNFFIKYSFKKNVAALAIGLLAVTQLFFVLPQPANAAGLPVIDVANLAANTTTAANATTQTTIQNVLNGLAWTIAKTTIQSITRSTVNWINSGFNGSPAFVSDLTTNLNNLSDAVANNFFANLNKVAVDTTGFNIVSPFQDQVAQQLRAEYYRATGSAVGAGYSLNAQSTNPKAFLAGDFSQGGFNAFFSASQNPSNNPFGAYTQASNALWASIDAAAQQRKSEIDWGKGFLPWRGSCDSSPEITALSDDSLYVDPAAPASTPGSANLSTSEKCTSNPVKTPGSVIESQLENSLGTGIRQLELADSINEIVGALVGQMVNQVLGAGGLLGTSQPTPGGGPSYVDQAANSSALTTSSALSQGVMQNILTDQTAITAYRDAWQTILTAANVAQQTCSIRPEITAVITTATNNVARGNTALSLLQQVQTEVQTAASTVGVNQSTAITTALTDYQSFLASPIVPNALDQSDAVIESTDTSGDSSTTPSLLTQMLTFQKTCHASTT